MALPDPRTLSSGGGVPGGRELHRQVRERPNEPPVVGLVSVSLVVACAWLTEDHLDSYDLGWLPDRVRGVDAALA